MGEVVPQSGSSEADATRWYDYSWPPRTPDDIATFFKQKEMEDSDYKGFSSCAYVVAGSLEAICYAVRTKNQLEICLPLKPGNAPLTLYKNETQPPHLALRESVYYLTNAQLRADDLSQKKTYGHVWWQGRYNDTPMNFLEVYSWDDEGPFMRWELMSEVPEHLSIPQPKDRFQKYPPQLARAIRHSRRLQRLSSGMIHAARDQELNYYEFIQGLPETEERPAA